MVVRPRHGAPFRRFCRRHGILPHPVETFGDAADLTEDETADGVFLCLGDEDDLRELARQECVESWHWAMNASIGVVAAGSGEASEGAKRRLHQAKQVAIGKAEDADIAERRPFTPDPYADQLRQAAEALGIDPHDGYRMPLLGELLRLCTTGQTDSPRAKALRYELSL